MYAEFKPFNKILHISKLPMAITQKIHGSNAQITIWSHDGAKDGIYNIAAGSRTRWLTIEDDNYRFCTWVMDNKDELIATLGEGRHYGEWAGPGINAGEGLNQKTFCLFNWKKWVGKILPANVTTVPVLYHGGLSLDAINASLDRLKTNGSYLVPGYMHPEGIVIDIDGQLYKNVFDTEETRWKEKTRIHINKPHMDISYLLQPIRLGKLFSRDENYIKEYPVSLSRICSDYFKDLEEEKQFRGINDDELKLERKALGKEIFYFVKSIISGLK